MKLKISLAMLTAFFFALNVVACCGNGKTTTEQKQVISAPTVGQQLEDLDKAYKTGSITKEEYEKLRKDIMDKASQSK